MRSITFDKINITGGFWKARQEINRSATINAVWNRFSDTGRVKAFDFKWKEGDDCKPHIFWDSDIAKWIESAAYIIAKNPDKELENKIERIIDRIEENQHTDGYFNLYYTLCEPGKRFTDRTCHELYCLGHLIEAAVAYYNATGKDRFINLLCKYLDLVEKVFVKENSAAFVTPGHEEIELALFKLYGCTGNERWLDLAMFFLNMRGTVPHDQSLYEGTHPKYSQSHLPVREQFEAVGHCVRACYLYSAMADAALTMKDEKLKYACERIFDDIVNKKMYITGGLGSSHKGESFTVSYDLPNETAYAETCAAISLAFFAQRMFILTGESKYADAIERVMYNGIIAGISLDGISFFYENPLEINLINHSRHICVNNGERLPITQRKEVFDCSCCPPNLTRFVASLGDYIFAENGDAIYVNQFIESEYEENGQSISIRTEYPSQGTVEIKSSIDKAVAVRIPSWCSRFTASVPYTRKGGYIFFDKGISDIIIIFDISPVINVSNPLVWENAGKCAITAGPVVYCAEGVDNGDLRGLFIKHNPNFTVEYSELYKTNIIKASAVKYKDNGQLYSTREFEKENTELTLIPYFAFANRGESDMKVWINVE